MFGVSQSRERDAFDTLAETVRSNANSRSGEAVFWAAQQATRAPSLILEALERDSAPESARRRCSP